MNDNDLQLAPRLKCLRCGYQWWPRFTARPRICPNCKSPYWDKTRIKDKSIRKDKEVNALSYIDQYEHEVEAKLRLDFSLQIDSLEQALNILCKCIRQFMLASPDLEKEIVELDYRELSPGTLGFFVSSNLLDEALTRLLAARVLFLHGYLSRALASTRDSLEAAMVANVCRNDDQLSKKWFGGGQIKLTNKYKYSPIFDWGIWQNAQAIMNPLGTHAYSDATFLSSVIQGAMVFPNDDEFQRRYVHDSKFVLTRMLVRCFQILVYIKNTYPEAKRKVAEFDHVLTSMKSIMDKELQLSLDEQLIIQNTSNHESEAIL